MAQKQPRVLAIDGSFQRSLIVTPYAYSRNKKENVQYDPVEYAAVAGVAVAGSSSTVVKDQLEEAIPSDVVGNTFSFKIHSGFIDSETGKILGHADNFFTLNAIQYTVKMFGAFL